MEKYFCCKHCGTDTRTGWCDCYSEKEEHFVCLSPEVMKIAIKMQSFIDKSKKKSGGEKIKTKRVDLHIEYPLKGEKAIIIFGEEVPTIFTEVLSIFPDQK